VRSRYGRELEFGLSIVPESANVELARELARVADDLDLDVVGIQDHPYQWRFLETWSLIGDLLVRTERVRLFPDVANLPLRLPAMIAKQAASLDVLSGGRFELGLGAGAFWEAIGATGGPVRSGGQALKALEEAMHIIRAFWSGERTISFEGEHYSVRGLHPGPPPAHPIGIWLGVYGPRALQLAARAADGWVPSFRGDLAQILDMTTRLDQAAADAGRDPREIRRVLNIGGAITDGGSAGVLNGPVGQWADELTDLAVGQGFDTFVLWADGPDQLARFAEEVVPAVRAHVAAERS